VLSGDGTVSDGWGLGCALLGEAMETVGGLGCAEL
jgi:hypothetical protein